MPKHPRPPKRPAHQKRISKKIKSKTVSFQASRGSLVWKKTKKHKKVQKTLDILHSCGIITNVPGDKPATKKQNMRIWRNWQTR
nr:MAG TPA: hypothetical protein [Caudoviricetes sp.]